VRGSAVGWVHPLGQLLCVFVRWEKPGPTLQTNFEISSKSCPPLQRKRTEPRAKPTAESRRQKHTQPPPAQNLSSPKTKTPPSSHPLPPTQKVELPTATVRRRCLRARFSGEIPARHEHSSPAVQALTAQLAGKLNRGLARSPARGGGGRGDGGSAGSARGRLERERTYAGWSHSASALRGRVNVAWAS